MPSGTPTPTGHRASTRPVGLPPKKFLWPHFLLTRGTCSEQPSPAFSSSLLWVPCSSPSPRKAIGLPKTLDSAHFFTRAPPGPPGTPHRPVTDGGATHQVQAPALPPGPGQGASTLQSELPESRDDPGQPHSPGPLAAADGGSETRGGRTVFASELAADLGSSFPAPTKTTGHGPISWA